MLHLIRRGSEFSFRFCLGLFCLFMFMTRYSRLLGIYIDEGQSSQYTSKHQYSAVRCGAMLYNSVSPANKHSSSKETTNKSLTKINCRNMANRESRPTKSHGSSIGIVLHHSGYDFVSTVHPLLSKCYSSLQ